MGSEVSGKVLRAVGGLLLKPDDEAARPVTTHAKVSPGVRKMVGGKDALFDNAIHVTVIEACNGRSYLRVETPGAFDEDAGVLIDKYATQRVLASDTVVIEGNEILAPWRKALERADGSTPAKILYPDLSEARPPEGARVAFSMNPRELSRVMRSIAGCGVSTVEVLLPQEKGAPVKFRGTGSKDDRLRVEAAIMPSDFLTATQGDEPQAAAGPKGPPLLPGPAPAALPGPVVPALPVIDVESVPSTGEPEAEPLPACVSCLGTGTVEDEEQRPTTCEACGGSGSP